MNTFIIKYLRCEHFSNVFIIKILGEIMEIGQLKQFLNGRRTFVLAANFENFVATCRDYVDAIQQRPFEAEPLQRELFAAVALYEQRDVSAAPPRLCRRPGESIRQLWGRECDSWKLAAE